MTFLINPYRFGPAYDTDAQAYITAVEAADGQALETGVRDAINTFVVGCKADGIWTAIKACCILAGARTLAGALVPLRGTAPTNNNFVSGDYNRKTGLVGNGSSKYLNSNYTAPAGNASNMHISAYASSIAPLNVIIGAGSSASARHFIYQGTSGGLPYLYCLANNGFIAFPGQITLIVGLSALSRSSSASYSARHNGTDYTSSTATTSVPGVPLYVFAENSSGTPNAYTSAGIAFYSIGESLTLSLLDSRVSTLITAIAAAIP